MPPKHIPVSANPKADPTQKESSNVNERKKTAEKLVIHTFRLATQRRACRRAVPARYRRASESKITPANASSTKSNSAKRMIGTADGSTDDPASFVMACDSRMYGEAYCSFRCHDRSCRRRIGLDRKSTRLNSSHLGISY